MAKHFTAEFKLEAAKLVIDGYTYVKAAEAVNVSHSAITRWVNKLQLERQGKTPAGLPPASIAGPVVLSDKAEYEPQGQQLG
ncbi:MAG: transposase [Symbiopectobacterium sp.]